MYTVYDMCFAMVSYVSWLMSFVCDCRYDARLNMHPRSALMKPGQIIGWSKSQLALVRAGHNNFYSQRIPDFAMGET